MKVSVDLIRLLQPVMPALTGSAVWRSVLFAQFSSHPWTLGAQLSLTEMRSFATSPSVDEVLRDLVEGPPQQGVAPGQLTAPLVIGWGRHDRVCLPRQAQRALRAFPGASLHWFEHSGHFPHWDMPEQTAELILKVTR
ncbi:alpha/beta fold hydrolase [Deinococcus malanensis]|uniref:alpha/beta fold hydrolase n=1 Tax=Deinococcus malanensis TaxID=1706855 RepID=UPI00362AAAB6